MQTEAKQRHMAVPLDPADSIAAAAKSGEAIWEGSLACREVASGLAVAGANQAGLVFVGLTTEGLDNTGGLNGVFGRLGSQRLVAVNTRGQVALPITGPTPIPGQKALLVDNETVTADAAVATQAIEVGVFVQPSDFEPTEWMVRYDVNA